MPSLNSSALLGSLLIARGQSKMNNESGLDLFGINQGRMHDDLIFQNLNNRTVNLIFEDIRLRFRDSRACRPGARQALAGCPAISLSRPGHKEAYE